MAEMLARLSPKTYQEYVHHKRGQVFIYCELTVDLCGILMVSCILHIAIKSLKARVEIIPYDWCIANNIIDTTQCIIVWHVDDLKISHQKPSVVNQVIMKP